jgi:hypothetical protein
VLRDRCADGVAGSGKDADTGRAATRSGDTSAGFFYDRTIGAPVHALDRGFSRRADAPASNGDDHAQTGYLLNPPPGRKTLSYQGVMKRMQYVYRSNNIR